MGVEPAIYVILGLCVFGIGAIFVIWTRFAIAMWRQNRDLKG